MDNRLVVSTGEGWSRGGCVCVCVCVCETIKGQKEGNLSGEIAVLVTRMYTCDKMPKNCYSLYININFLILVLLFYGYIRCN